MLRHVVTVRDFTPSFLDSVFRSAAASKRQHAGRGRGARVRWSPHWNALRDHVMISLFYEASTRTQSERHDVATGGDSYALTDSLASALHGDAIVLYPLPRNRELPEAINRLSQARYFEQARNGLFVRMAVLLWVFGELAPPTAAPGSMREERAYA